MFARSCSKIILLAVGIVGCLTMQDLASGMSTELYAVSNIQINNPFPTGTTTEAHLYKVDPSTGAATFLVELSGTPAKTIAGIDFRASGELFAVTQFGDIATIDLTSGEVSLLNTDLCCNLPRNVPGLSTSRYWGIAFSPTDELFVVGEALGAGSTLVKVESSDGTVDSFVQLQSEDTFGARRNTIDFSTATAGSVLYGGSLGLYTIDEATGITTPVVEGLIPLISRTLDIDSNDIFWGTNTTDPSSSYARSTLVQIDPLMVTSREVSDVNIIPGTVVGLASRPSLGGGDYDFDGDVDGYDFLLWQRDPSVGSLADWEANYGLPLIANTKTVPEPTSFILALATLCLVPSR